MPLGREGAVGRTGGLDAAWRGVWPTGAEGVAAEGGGDDGAAGGLWDKEGGGATWGGDEADEVGGFGGGGGGLYGCPRACFRACAASTVARAQAGGGVSLWATMLRRMRTQSSMDSCVSANK